MGIVDGHVIAMRRVRLGAAAVVNHQCVASGTPISLKPGAVCLGGTDSSGMNLTLTECVNAGDAAHTRRQNLLAPPADLSVGDVTLSADQLLDVTTLGSNPVVDFASLKLQPNVVLTVRGNTATQTIVLRIARNLLVGSGGRIVTEGFAPGPRGSAAERVRVIVLVGGKAKLGNESVVEGTIFTEKKLAVGRWALVRGALLSRDGPMTFARGAVLTFKPWLDW